MFRSLILAASIGLSGGAATAQIESGAYLAGRQAQNTGNFTEAARYLSRALQGDPQNFVLLEQLVGAHLSLGDGDRARDVAQQLAQTGATSQLANLALLAGNASQGDWTGILDDMDAGLSVGPLFDGLARAWAEVGAGQTDAALATFDGVAEERGIAAFGAYHKALALASLGRFEEADEILSADDLSLTRRGSVAHAQILSQLGRFDDASARLASAFGNGTLDEPLSLLKERLDAGEAVPFTIARDATEGIAEVAFDIGNILLSEAAPTYTLLYGRTVTYLRPDHVEAILMNASLLDRLEQYDLATDALAAIPEVDPAYAAAEIGRAEILIKSDRVDDAIGVLEDLAARFPERPSIHVSLGDALREADRYEDANAAYDAAIETFGGETPDQWIVYFARAVTFERTGDWDAAEADFRQALEINSESPTVLNYLGYSLLERGEKLDEALGMIERAVAARPDSGYIVDSLGWGLYRLGRFEEAVEPMENAVELVPVDPVINDHLGDVYWMVGRKLEARFQWQRALSFVDNDQNDEVDPERIRRKLDVGLDQIIAEEDGTPQVVNDDG